MNGPSDLSRNLAALLASDEEIRSDYKLSRVANVPASTIGRIRRDEVSPQVDTVRDLARAFRLRACDLLDPDLAARIAVGQPRRISEARPPVVDEDAWRRLTPRTRAFVEEVTQRAGDGRLDEATVVWLHDAMSRLAPVSVPVAQQSRSSSRVSSTEQPSFETSDFVPAPSSHGSGNR